MPHSKADRFGFGGSSIAVSLLAGKGGLPGSAGGSMLGRRLICEIPLGSELVGRRASLPFSFSCTLLALFSGKGGKLAGSYSGALTRFFVEPSGFLELTLKLVLVEIPDIDDLPEAIEETDSTDCFLFKLCVSDGLLGGRGGTGLPFEVTEAVEVLLLSFEYCEGLRGGRVGVGGSDLSHFLKLGAGSMPSLEGKGGEG
jgi:hypothetical protein